MGIHLRAQIKRRGSPPKVNHESTPMNTKKGSFRIRVHPCSSVVNTGSRSRPNQQPTINFNHGSTRMNTDGNPFRAQIKMSGSPREVGPRMDTKEHECRHCRRQLACERSESLSDGLRQRRVSIPQAVRWALSHREPSKSRTQAAAFTRTLGFSIRVLSCPFVVQLLHSVSVSICVHPWLTSASSGSASN